jgi:hypothetical protein
VNPGRKYDRDFSKASSLNNNYKKSKVFDRLGKSTSLLVMNSSPNLFSIPKIAKINKSNTVIYQLF